MHVQIQRKGGGGLGGPDPIPGKSQVLSNSIEISIWTPPPLVNSWTPPRIPGKFGLKNPKTNIKNQGCFLAVGLGPPPSLTKKLGSAHALTIQQLTPCGVGEAEINLLVPQKSKICFPGFHVPQHFLCLLVPLKSCTYLLCSLEINAPLPCFQKPMEGVTNY